MPESADPSERWIRDHLARLERTQLPPDVLERVDRTVRTTPQVRPAPEWTRRAAPLVAALLLVAILVTGGPFLYGTLVGPGATATPQADQSAPAATAPPTAPGITTPSPAASAASTPRPTPAGSPTMDFDLRGTAWRLAKLPGVPLTPATTPRIDFGSSENDGPYSQGGIVFDGCAQRGLESQFIDGQISALSLGEPDRTCGAPAVRDAFVPRLASMTAWAVIGDSLLLSGPSGTLEFVRDLPPVGDPGRALAEALRTGLWLVTSGTGITSADLSYRLDFSDRLIGGRIGSSCGFGAEVAFQAGGGLAIDNTGLDTVFCSDRDQREVVLQLLSQATNGVLESPTRARLSGPAGGIQLTRLSASFPTRTSTLAFTSEGGEAVTITIHDGSSWLTGAAKAGPLPQTEPTEPTDAKVFITNPSGNQAALHVLWEASGGCRPAYTLTIAPDVRSIWIEQLTPPGGDSLGGECMVELTFSRPVPATGVEGSLSYPN